LTGTPYPELNGTYCISSSSGFVAEINFSGKGFLGMSGTKNRFEASLYHAGDADKKPLYTAKGGWNDRFTMHDVASNADLETYDTNAEPATPLNVAPIDEQDPWESRRAWRGVIDALNQGNMQATSDEKGKVEEGQRAMRKRQGLGEKEWCATFFKNVDGDEVFERLAEPIGAELGKEKTVGVWKFDHEKARVARKPYRGDLTPTA
jgi:oxysterol-binding protein-related protein 9/10/11